MKLLIDANLSYRLANRVRHLFPQILHVEQTTMPNPASDIEIWEWAATNGYSLILTRNEDFVQIQNLRGSPPKVVMLRIDNRSTKYVAELLELHFQDILDLENDQSLGLLEIFEP